MNTKPLFDYYEQPSGSPIPGMVWHRVGNVVRHQFGQMFVCDRVTEGAARFRPMTTIKNTVIKGTKVKAEKGKTKVVYAMAETVTYGPQYVRFSAQTEPSNILRRMTSDELKSFLTVGRVNTTNNTTTKGQNSMSKQATTEMSRKEFCDSLCDGKNTREDALAILKKKYPRVAAARLQKDIGNVLYFRRHEGRAIGKWKENPEAEKPKKPAKPAKAAKSAKPAKKAPAKATNPASAQPHVPAAPAASLVPPVPVAA